MCGIAGFIDFKNRSSTKEVLVDMSNTLLHRGPDGDGVFYESNNNAIVGLAHKRLSIIDLSSSASQPMHYKHWVLVFNGEIYNYQDVKKELEGLGHSFQTHSDTEVILHSFEQWGNGCIDKFIGMFVIVIYNKQEGGLTIFRDRAGVKPLYYYWHEGLFMFASELKAFHKHPRFLKQINYDALALYLKYSYIPAPHSIFNNTYKLLPGHFLKLSMSSSELSIQKYWDVNKAYSQPKLNIDDKEAIDETEKILKKAFDYRMVADVPVGVFLSGGYDSTAVTALLQKDRSEKIKTYTIGFEDQQFNEAPYAKEIANYLSTEHTEYYCTVDDAKKILPNLPYYYDEPFGDSSAIPTMLLSKLARRNVTVSLSADGGDEAFAGYYRHDIIQKVDSLINPLPNFIRSGLYHVSGLISPERFPILKDKKLIGQRYTKLRKVLAAKAHGEYLKSICSIMDDNALRDILKNDYHNMNTLFEESQDEIPDTLSQVLAMDYKTYMVDDILTKVDRATMSVGLEGREPFLDNSIIEWVSRLPNDMKIRDGSKKWILKQIVHKHVPKQLMDRPKSGFAIPIEDWFKVELKEYFDTYFSKNYIESQQIFNFNELNKYRSLHEIGFKEHMPHLWNMLMFQLWYEEWMS